MPSKYTRKSKQPPASQGDEFVSFWNRVYDVVEPHARTVAIASGALLVALVAIWAIDHFLVAGRQDATEAYGRALRIYQAELLPADDKKDDKGDKGDKKKDEKEGDVPRFKTEKERAEATLAELDKLDKEHGSSDAARRARLTRAGVLYDLGRFDDAEAAFRKAGEKAGASDPDGALAREGVGLCKEATGKLDEALTAYQELEKSGGEAFRDRAMFDEARVLAKKGDKKRAADVLKDILKKAPQTPLKDDITARLASLEGA